MSISIKSINKTFGSYAALENISLEVPDGSLTALLGPSGSGKPPCCGSSPGWNSPIRAKEKSPSTART